MVSKGASSSFTEPAARPEARPFLIEFSTAGDDEGSLDDGSLDDQGSLDEGAGDALEDLEVRGFEDDDRRRRNPNRRRRERIGLLGLDLC